MRILWLKSDLLHPVDRGGRIRTYQIVKRLAERHEVTYVALDDGTGDPDARDRAHEYSARAETVPYRRSRRLSPRFYWELLCSLFSTLPYSLARYRVPALSKRLQRLVPAADLVVCDFLTPAVNLVLPLERPTVLFQHNVEAEIWRRHADATPAGPKRWLFSQQWRRMRRYEASVCRVVDHVIAVSDTDRLHFEREYGVSEVSTVPTGVDLDYFSLRPDIERNDGEVVFVGSLDWMPNTEGMFWFVKQVWPSVLAEVPHARLTIVGLNPPPALRALEARPDITVTGRVDDVRPYLARASVFVVPLHVGGGTRLKIYEAMAMGCPVVSTTVGAEGLPLTPGKQILLADDSAQFAQDCSTLLRSQALRQGIVDDGTSFVRLKCGWDAAADDFSEICQRVVAGRC